MNRAKTTLLLALALVLVASARGWSAQQEKIRVLLTTGGHEFEAQPFFALFDTMPEIVYTKATLPNDAGLLQPGLEKNFDVIVRYDMVAAITPQQQKAFVDLLNKGIGLVALHHNLAAHPNWDQYRKILGGQFQVKPMTIDGKAYPQSPWRHDEDLTIQVVDHEHPITRGIQNFQIHDESYGPFYTAPDIHVLLKTDHPRNNPLVAWTHHFGKSRVVYLMLGHDGKAYENPTYGELLRRSIRWTAQR